MSIIRLVTIPFIIEIVFSESRKRIYLHLEFHDLIIEAQEFKNFGFSLNRTLRMAIMRKRALFDDVEHLTEMIKAYKNVIKKLSSAEVISISAVI